MVEWREGRMLCVDYSPAPRERIMVPAQHAVMRRPEWVRRWLMESRTRRVSELKPSVS